MEDYPILFDLQNSSDVLEDTSGGLITDNPLLGVPTAVILCLLCLMTFFGNAVVLHAIRTERRLQTVENIRRYAVSIQVFHPLKLLRSCSEYQASLEYKGEYQLGITKFSSL
ncbi:uncharacterized protein NPIL_474771 [Nephila pilipes]|uniref:Uncharacterized protein n=1 Tax=Nephila pilipes TaxID=299642 RepID=A0A8X6J3A8_NEPPI|nr:uncharacterized protein NPIL_474771 [Nephila pilipes]